MIKAPIPTNEAQRLEALRTLGILDTPPEERFDRITRLATHLFDVPVALVSLVDANRQWFKSCQGLCIAETSRDVSFCGHAILTDEVMVIPDALLDPRFADNPLVTGSPGIRFYAGQPLRAADGSRIGVFCINDFRPRSFGPEKVRLLKDLAGLVQDQLHLIDAAELRREVERRRQVEEELRASERQARQILDTAYDAFVAMDADGRITDWNHQAEITFGWSHAEALGQPVADIIVPALYRERHWEGLRHFLATGEGPLLNRRLEVTALHRDGHEFPVELAISPLGVGSTYVFNAFVHDITERKRGEGELRQAKEAAEVANLAKSQFLANMSHEIRTPMNGILGMTELALDTDLTPEQRRYLDLVKNSAEALLTVINDILDFSKIEAGKLDLEAIPFPLRDRLGDTMKTLALRGHKKGLELACHIAPDVPDNLVGDPGRLGQVIINLVGNALKFTEKGEVVAHVEVESQADGQVVLHFAVRDTGVGIPRDKQAQLFEPFTQADSSTTRQFGGTGLGLAISRRLVDMMGGRIWLESEANKGSTFHFTARLGVQKEVARQVDAEPVNLRGISVLVVDDNATNRLILEEVLTRWGMRPVLADSAPAALAAMEQAAGSGEPFALVLSDVQMPGVDGFHLVEQIRGHPEFAGATVMMLSSADEQGETARCRQAGVAAYLTKPFKQSELLDAVVNALGAVAGKGKPAGVARRNTPAAGSGRSRLLHILLVEDNATNQMLAIALLEKHGHTVVVAGNGKEALAVLDQESFDLVLMDVQMPVMDGFEAMIHIRGKERGTGRHQPVIAMTAHAMKGDRDRCLAAGMDAYVSKPVHAEELYQTMARLVPAVSPEGIRDGEVREDVPGAMAEVITPTPVPAGVALDKSALLARVGGREDRLRKIITLFQEESSKLLGEMREAITSGEPARLKRPAHSLKGAAGIFGVPGVIEAAQHLESLSQTGELAGAEEAYARLETELARLEPALAALVLA